jgi:peptidoglycan/LPS O-acetylase OafA/YrhL
LGADRHRSHTGVANALFARDNLLLHACGVAVGVWLSGWQMETQKLEFIDALRGWAILLVILVHAVQGPMAIDALRLPPSEMRQFILVPTETIARLCFGGLAGVQLFFVVSALSLTLSWQARRPAGAAGLRDYFLRRFFRVAPMFYFGIGLYLLLFGWNPRQFAPDGISGLDIALTALFLHGWWPTAINSVVPGGWSIADEAMFYLVLPGLMLFARSLTWVTISTVAVLVASRLIFFFAAQHTPSGWSFPDSLWPPMLFWGFQSQVPNFMFGILAAAIIRKWPSAGSRESRWQWEGVLAVALFVIMILMYTYVDTRWLPSATIFSACAAGLCVLLSRSPTPILVNSVMARIGRVSFSMYILHFALLAPVFGGVVTILRMLNANSAAILPVYYPALVGATFAAACITFVLIEARFMALGRQLIAWLRREGSLSVPTAVSEQRLQPSSEGLV